MARPTSPLPSPPPANWQRRGGGPSGAGTHTAPEREPEAVDPRYYAPAPPADHAYAPQGYAQPDYGHGHQHAGHATPAHGYADGAPEHGYAREQGYARDQGHAREQGYPAHPVEPHPDDHLYRAAPHAGHGVPAYEPASHGHHPSAAYHGGHAAPAHDPRAYDPRAHGADPYGQRGDPRFAHLDAPEPAPHGHGGHGHGEYWGQAGQGGGRPHEIPEEVDVHGRPLRGYGASAYYGQEGYGQGGYHPDVSASGAAAGHYDDPRYYAPAGQAAEPEGDLASDDGSLDGEERSGRRGLMIVGALVGAIALGGGLAYAYKQFGGGGRSQSRPVATKPAPAGERAVADAQRQGGARPLAHADRKFMERLEESRTARGNGTAVADAASGERPAELDETGARRVRTLVIGRDGSVSGPPGGPAPVERSRTAAVGAVPPPPSVPGLVLDDGAPPRASAAEAPETPASRREPPPREEAASRREPPPRAPVRPTLIGRAPAAGNADAEREAPAPPRVAARVPPPRELPALRRGEPTSAAVPPPRSEPPSRSTAPPPPARNAPPAPAARSGPTGYVAVLSSQRSSMEALKAFADLQQRYGGVLQGKTPTVQEANLGAKGVWYRAVVGPPGSRAAAASLCTQMRASGYTGCWVTGY
jgi:hypothetical protein